MHHCGAWGNRILTILLFPLNRYIRYLVRNPQRTPANLMARAEPVFGADVHWVMQACMAAFAAALVCLACLFVGQVLVVVSMVISLMLLRWRWNWMKGFSTALPAGRLAAASFAPAKWLSAVPPIAPA
jgi:hypothetical protein